jgi:uncharacterized hydrophobic protein (TIGR00271 family)
MDEQAAPAAAWTVQLGPRAWLAIGRSVMALVVLVGWVAAPGRREDVLVGFTVLLVALSIAELVVALRVPGPGRVAALVRALAPVAGAAVMAGMNWEPASLPLGAGVVLLLRGAGEGLAAVSVGEQLGVRRWLVSLAAAEVLVGLASVTLTELFGQAGIVLLGLAWLGGGMAVPLLKGHDRELLTSSPLPRMEAMTVEERRRIAGEVFFDGEDLRRRLVRFAVLLALATTIATYGVLSGSVASVIGAMIVAPLMMPIQALTVATVMGSFAQARRAALVLSAGILGVVVLSMFLASTFRDLDVVLLGEQVMVRTSPSLTDLAVAAAAGLAGGFAMLRKDVADSLPGVAIAVSLVPPLCVSGALMAGGQPKESAGAFLLFAINFLAIVLCSGSVLVVGGFGAVGDGSGHRLLTAAAGFGVALVLLTVPLAITGLDTLRQETLQSTAEVEAARWLAPVEPADVLDLSIDGDEVTLLVTSVTRPPSPASLQQALTDSSGRPIDVVVHWVPAEVVE